VRSTRTWRAVWRPDVSLKTRSPRVASSAQKPPPTPAARQPVRTIGPQQSPQSTVQVHWDLQRTTQLLDRLFAE
jgi:hypothetical protein